MKKVSVAILIGVLCFSMFQFMRVGLNLREVKATGTIYITSDGSIDPPTAPIQRDGNIYTFTDNINDSIVVQKGDIIIEGNGKGVHPWGSALTLDSVNNVTVQNGSFSGDNDAGVVLQSSSSNNISGNVIPGDRWGIRISSSSNNIISKNSISSRYWVLEQSSSINNTISGNNITGKYPVRIDSSSNCTIRGNTILGGSGFDGIDLSGCFNNTIYENTVTGANLYGIAFQSSSSNTVFGNNVKGLYALSISSSSNNSFVHNNFRWSVDPRLWGVYVEGDSFNNVWDDGYPSGGNYWQGYTGVDFYRGPYQNETGRDGIGDSPFVINSTNQDDYPFTTPCYPPYTQPISWFDYAPNAPIVYETVTFNASLSFDFDGQITGYAWDFGDGTTITDANVVTTHSYMTPGTYLVTLNVTDNDDLMGTFTNAVNIDRIPTSISISTSVPSTFVGFRVNITGFLQDVYGNSLEDETVVLYYTFSGITTWTPITSDVTDGLGYYSAIWIPPATGDFLIKAEWAGNTTHSGASSNLTLNCIPTMNQYIFSVESTSTISALAFNTTSLELSFTASGPSGTNGYLKVTIAKSLIANITNVEVHLDNSLIEFSVTSAANSWILSFTYSHSSHDVRIDLVSTRIADITGPAGQPDGKCDMRDIGLVARNFGRTVPPAPANCDLTGPTAGVPDGIIDMRDISLVAKHYGERYQ